METFSDRLKSAMQKRGYSQKKLGEEVGVVPTRITNMLSNTTYPTGMTTVVEICRVLGISLDWLIWGDQNDEQDPPEIQNITKKLRGMDPKDLPTVEILVDGLFQKHQTFLATQANHA